MSQSMSNVRGILRGVLMTAKLSVDDIKLTEDSITIQWNDCHRSQYGTKALRINCGCAECVEEWSRRKLLDPATVPSDIRAEDYLMVGRYAVQFLWSDGHYTGIYPFDMLRRLCDCGECNSEET